MEKQKLLEIENLDIGFYVKKNYIGIVNHLNLTINEEEVVGIIGETGCGKSVTGNAVLHILPENAKVSGRILYKGKDILHINDEKFRELRGDEIMSVPQSPVTSLDPLMHVGDQVAECVMYKKKNPNRDQNFIKQMIKMIFKKLHFPENQDIYRKYPCELSGGMCQRILIAMGMITHPKLLVIDEPTKAIDWSLRKDVIKTLQQLKEEMNCAMFLITHDIQFAKMISDRVAVMYAGEIVEIGRTEDVLNHPVHPYTRGLILSMPENGFHTMKGFMPAFTDLPKGCRFSDRCIHCKKECTEGNPCMVDLGENHLVRCFVCRPV